MPFSLRPCFSRNPPSNLPIAPLPPSHAAEQDPWMVPGFSSIDLAREREATKTDSTFWKWDKVIAGNASPYFKEEGPHFKT
jgi:hypothetical protein